MIRKHLLELLNKELDGTLLPGESVTLQDSLSRDPLAQELRNELRSTVQTLDTLEMVEPPRSLKPGVLRAVQESSEVARLSVHKSWFSPILDLVRGGAKLKYAYAFSGGLVAGALLFALFLSDFGGSSFDDSSASGTLAMVGEKLSLDLQQIHGYILTEHSNTSNLLTLRLNSDQDISVRIAYDPNSVRFEGARVLQHPEMQLFVRTGEVEIAGRGSMGYKIAFASAVQTAPPVQIRMYASGQLIYDRSITIDRAGR